MTIGALHNSYIDFNQLKKPSDLNTLLYWRYYLELIGIGKIDQKLVDLLDEQLFLSFKWTKENSGLQPYEALFLILSLPISLFGKNIPDAIEKVVSENEELNYLKDELIRRVLQHYLVRNYGETGNNILYFQTHFQISNDAVQALRERLSKENFYIKQKEKAYRSILSNLDPLDILYVCLESSFDPIRYDPNLTFHKLLKQFIMELSPDDKHLYELLKILPNNDSEHLGKATLFIAQNDEYTVWSQTNSVHLI